MTKKLTALILILGSYFTALAETFVVTSNADSGTGTLREAIQKAAANGTTETDYIHFNIADESRESRTITLTSELPALTSRLIIDGSTQKGLAIGKSDAKVILYRPDDIKNFNFLQFQNCSNIEIYGLFFFGSYFNFSGISWDNNNKGISFRNSENITIGKNGKGNYFRGIQYGIYSGIDRRTEFKEVNSSNILIQANLFSLDEEGLTTLNYNTFYSVNPMGHAVYFINVTNITIGGSKEGANTSNADIFINSFLGSKSGFVKIWWNVMGVEKDPPAVFTYSHYYGKVRITILGGFENDDENPADYEVSIRNNILHGSIKLMKLSRFFMIQGNKMFIGNSAIDFTIRVNAVLCTAGGLIGGEQEEERNEIFTLASNMNNWTWGNSTLGSINVQGSPKVAIIKNIMRCNDFYGSSIQTNATTSYVRIDKTETNFVSGMATPNSRIEVFLDDECWACDGQKFLGEVTANADSSWSFTGSFTGVVIATAMGADKGTSEYTAPTYNSAKMVIQQPTCNQSNGSVTGIQLTGSWNNVEWHTTFVRDGMLVDSIVSRKVDLVNVPPGRYYFVSKLGETCRSSTIVVDLKDKTPKIKSDYVSLTHPSCGLYNGSIYGLQINNADYSVFQWKDEAGFTLKKGTNTWNTPIDKLPPGNFKLIVLDTIAGCGDSTDYFSLINQSGPSLNTSNMVITNATCEGKNGSIKIITATNVTGTPSIQWFDSLYKVVGTSLNLDNVPAGRYRLKFKDQSSCDTIITPFYFIDNAGALRIDTARMVVTSSQCPYASGTVKGIVVTGATAYQWFNSSGESVSKQLDPGFLLPGKYVLVASNAAGCEKRTDSIFVPTYPFKFFNQPLRAQIKPGFCGTNDGYVRSSNFPDPQNFTFRWVDSLQPNVVISTQLNLEGVRSGKFYLYAKDAKGCEQKALTAILDSLVPPQLEESKKVITADQCAQQLGKIENLQLKEGTGLMPLTFTWLDAQNNKIGDQLSLLNRTAGSYRLVVQDRIGCRDSSSWLQVNNVNKTFAMPVYEDQTILRHTSTTLVVRNYQQGTYQLFETGNGTTPLQQNETGVFETGLLSADKNYSIKLKTGTCESEMGTVHIKVVDETKVFVPTAFSPNGDGKNDVLRPKAFGIFYLENFSVYDRWGGVVFQSADLNKGWNGQYNRTDLPDGVYVWMIKGKDIKGNVIFQKGTTVLMR